MASSVEGRAKELIEDRNFCHVTTTNADGTPHVAVVWVDVDDEGNALLNSAEGRRWPANLRRDPRVVLTVVNLQNPYEYATVRGEAVEVTPDGADEHIDALAKKYLDKDEYPFRAPGEVRLKIRVRPDKVGVWGG